jgi:anaerobic C4-dicarboxylate transporter
MRNPMREAILSMPYRLAVILLLSISSLVLNSRAAAAEALPVVVSFSILG